ncbi:hypothetical protein ACRRTK_012158 [Alexandromys fortis]
MFLNLPSSVYFLFVPQLVYPFNYLLWDLGACMCPSPRAAVRRQSAVLVFAFHSV